MVIRGREGLGGCPRCHKEKCKILLFKKKPGCCINKMLIKRLYYLIKLKQWCPTFSHSRAALDMIYNLVVQNMVVLPEWNKIMLSLVKMSRLDGTFAAPLIELVSFLLRVFISLSLLFFCYKMIKYFDLWWLGGMFTFLAQAPQILTGT